MLALNNVPHHLFQNTCLPGPGVILNGYLRFAIALEPAGMQPLQKLRHRASISGCL